MEGSRNNKTLLHWGYYFTTMSLEGGRPYWDRMGLAISPSIANEFFQITADALPVYFGKATTMSELSESDLRHREIISQYIRTIIRKLSLLDDAQTAQILKWIYCTFLGGGDDSYEDLWRSVLYSLYWDLTEERFISGIPAHKRRYIYAVVRKFFKNSTRISEQLQVEREGPFTDNDENILGYYGQRDQWGAIALPFDIINSTCTCVLFRMFWIKLRAKGEKEVLDFLYQYFRAFAEARGVMLARPSLIHPPEIETW